ncbi:FtsX-like permease family protein [Actinoplanes sp. NPDC049316]|uniref:FtsX-like permease family protein n=1 Tax=Actinoplanes sp. NPDC049316 TaxID=3154727 RepID=UPI003442633F
MIALVRRRARSQWPVLAALLAVVTLGATLLGVCALLVTHSADLALGVAADRTDAEQATVTAYTSAIGGADAAAVADSTRDVLTSALAPFPVRTAARASSVLRPLPGRSDDARTYLSGIEDLPDRAELTGGRWPRAAGEAVLLEPTAKLLRLRVGSRVHLAAKPPEDPAPAVDLTVVGVARPLPGGGWDRDPLAGTGFQPDFTDGSSVRRFPAYGPFLVNLDGLLSGGSSLSRLEITAHPDFSGATPATLSTLAAGVRDADPRLTGMLGDRARFARVGSQLADTLRAQQRQQDITEAAVLAVAVLGSVLTAVALMLAGRLTAGLRAAETSLLSALGTSRVQLAGVAALEAGVIAVVATALAVPLSALLHSGLSHLPPMVGAGLTAGPALAGAQILAVGAGALALTLVLVLIAIRAEVPHGDRGRREVLARTGADLLLVVFAGLGWWQLHARGADTDLLQVLAPALMLIAGAALALRLVPPALRIADRFARRSDGLPVPLAAFEAARRPQAAAAGLLICLAAATGTFAVAFDSSWHRSQGDQADLAVGTDLAVALTTPPVAGQGAAITAATGAAVVSPAANRGLAIGQWLGDGVPPRLVAADTTHANELFRGRLPGGRDWAQATRGLAPDEPVRGVPLPLGGTFSLAMTATGGVPLTVAPALLLQDRSGLRTTCTSAPFALDGTRHAITGCLPAEGMQLIAVALPVDTEPGYFSAGENVSIEAVLRLPAPAGDLGAWTAASALPDSGRLQNLTMTATGATVRMAAKTQIGGAASATPTFVATAFRAPEAVPVLISRALADGIGVTTGSHLDLLVGNTGVPVEVAGVVPQVPAAPGTAAVLADLDTLTRVLAAYGDLQSPVDAWWAAAPARNDVASLRLGTVTTRAGETARLTAGPLNAGLPAVLRLLIPAAVLLLLAGVLLHVTHDLRDRAVEVARLRGLGLTGRQIRTVLLGQHTLVLIPLLAAGALVGALATWIITPLLIRSETGAPPVPGVAPVWPWTTESFLLLLLVAGCAAAAGSVATLQARRAGAAQLREAA